MPFQQTVMTQFGINATYWVVSQVNVCMNPLALAAHIEVQGFADSTTYASNPSAVLDTLVYDWPYHPLSIPLVDTTLTGDALTAAEAAYAAAVTAQNAVIAAMAQFPFAPTYVAANFSGSLFLAAAHFVMIQGALVGATVVS